jgi:hypothetical protein
MPVTLGPSPVAFQPSSFMFIEPQRQVIAQSSDAAPNFRTSVSSFVILVLTELVILRSLNWRQCVLEPSIGNSVRENGVLEAGKVSAELAGRVKALGDYRHSHGDTTCHLTLRLNALLEARERPPECR